MSATATAMPSRKLLVVLAFSLVLAALTVGRTYLGAGSDEAPDDFQEYMEVEDVGPERIVVDTWVPPANPRDPFLQVDLDGPLPAADDVGS